ncbi:MAG: CHAT domain-containing protein [Jaaginema sp. PMC 1079.18]|nr:CHAT domain-containing protein [Jaaginema sp. PMC 1080.18]MEC4850643.1 CHAT domain-containing protein [Jaaginema sp. PMC 1079.18]MEC4867795.1 CHAT domain-containing protein [Jaaginema sp. PMC 1078.18]
MTVGVTPCLSLAIERLTQTGSDNFAIWVLKAPLSSAYGFHHCSWPHSLTRKWLAWQEMFSLQTQLHLPVTHNDLETIEENPTHPSEDNAIQGYGGRLMQDFGIGLWQWLFSDSIRNSFAQSRGVAHGQSQMLRLRLDLRDPDLIPLPWEIMQPEAGKQSISLNQKLLFSRTISDVDPLSPVERAGTLRILLVLGENQDVRGRPKTKLQLENEADLLREVLNLDNAIASANSLATPVKAEVETLLQPTTAELIEALETHNYNVFFFAGHGIPAPDGGLLYLAENQALNGTELAQVLVRTRVTLAVFNACWGAQPDCREQRAIPRSSLAEVLVHQGVPAVLAMRDSIADAEALSFIEAFTSAIASRQTIDSAVAIARQQLLMLYKFNQPAWTLPILYMHPEFEGQLIQPLEPSITELPTILPSNLASSRFYAFLRPVDTDTVVPATSVRGGLMRIGRKSDNDLAITEKWVSQSHAKIFCREVETNLNEPSCFYLEDDSRFGTFVYSQQGWRKIHHQEIRLYSGVHLKFGSLQGQTWEFAIEVEPG